MIVLHGESVVVIRIVIHLLKDPVLPRSHLIAIVVLPTDPHQNLVLHLLIIVIIHIVNPARQHTTVNTNSQRIDESDHLVAAPRHQAEAAEIDQFRHFQSEHDSPTLRYLRGPTGITIVLHHPVTIAVTDVVAHLAPRWYLSSATV